MKSEIASAADVPSSLLLEVRALSKSFRVRNWRGGKVETAALKDIHLALPYHARVAVVGKSGAGKSTLAKCLALLEPPDSGEIKFDGTDLRALPRKQLRSRRAHFQIVFQHSATALSPRFSALQAVAEPLRVQKAAIGKEVHEQASDMLERVGIPPQSIHRSTHEFSGGQRQRIALARALVLRPKLLVLDEALSGLDLATQALMAKMLLDLHASLSLAYLFITHDLEMAAHMAADMVILDSGRIVESGSCTDLLKYPQRAETRELIAAIPTMAPRPADVIP